MTVSSGKAIASCHTILWWASLTMQMCSISISCQRCRKKLCMFYLPQILKLFYCEEESYWSPFLCPKNNSCMVFSWSIVSCVRMWQVVLGYIVPVAEVTTDILTYTNIFQMTKEVALTWLDIALTLKILVEYFYKHCRPRWDATVLKSRTIHIDIICFCLFELMLYIPCQQFLSYVGMISCLPGSNQYQAADKVSCSSTHLHSESVQLAALLSHRAS